MIAMRLPRVNDEEQLAIGMAGITGDLRENRDTYLAVLREEIARYEAIAAMPLDTFTAALIAEILNVERQHEESLGGKFMSA